MQESLQSTCCHMYRRRTLGLTYCISIIDGHVMPCTDTLIHQKKGHVMCCTGTVALVSTVWARGVKAQPFAATMLIQADN
jgi:hypothetical protein